MPRRRSLCAGSALVLTAMMTHAAAGAVTYSGILTSTTENNGQVQGIGKWIEEGPTTLEWEVTDNGSSWHYRYVLTVPKMDVSHLIIGVSDAFEASDFWNATGAFGSTQIGDFDQGNGNPDIPQPLHGLKFDDTSGTTLIIEFDCNRAPVWGDFYAKDGGNPNTQAWNAGITLADPTDAPADGSIDDHLLVPDSVIPEPATMTFLALGALAVARIRRRTGQ